MLNIFANRDFFRVPKNDFFSMSIGWPKILGNLKLPKTFNSFENQEFSRVPLNFWHINIYDFQVSLKFQNYSKFFKRLGKNFSQIFLNIRILWIPKLLSRNEIFSNIYYIPKIIWQHKKCQTNNFFQISLKTFFKISLECLIFVGSMEKYFLSSPNLPQWFV